MSNEALTWAWQQHQLNMAEKLVLIRLADYADDQHSCWPSITTITRYCALNDRTVRRALAHMAELKILSVEARWNPKGDRTSNRYYLNVGVGASDPQVGASDPHPPGVQTPTPLAPDPHHVEPSVEPSPEPIEIIAGARGRSGFELFWQTYPRKAGKRTAQTAFERALRRSSLVAILEGAARYRDDPNREAQFTAHASTWLNRDGWEDEPLPQRNTAPKLGVLDSILIGARREIDNAGDTPDGGRVGREDGSVLPELPGAGWDGG